MLYTIFYPTNLVTYVNISLLLPDRLLCAVPSYLRPKLSLLLPLKQNSPERVFQLHPYVWLWVFGMVFEVGVLAFDFLVALLFSWQST